MTPTRTRTAIVALVLLLIAASSQAVVIFFKDGSKEIVVDSYRIDGDRILVTLQSGQVTTLPLHAVDLEKTEAMGKVARGSAVVLDTAADDSVPLRERTLRDLMREREAAPRSAEGGRDAQAGPSLRRTPAGNVDYLAVEHRPVAPSARGHAVAELLRRRGLTQAQAFQGTRSDRVLIDVITGSGAEVFAALTACAEVLRELREVDPGVDALELAMATASRSRAGQFVLTSEQAEALHSGAVTPSEHFLAEVLF